MEETNVTNQVEDKETIVPEQANVSAATTELENYIKLDTEDLIEAVKSLVDTAPIQSIKAQIDESKKIFYDRSNKAYKDAYEKFKATQVEGEEPENFEFVYPNTDAFKAVMETYKKRRNAFYNEQEKEMSKNLKIKLNLIEELKGLLNAEEKIKVTFDHFKDIQARWKAVGQVPKSDLNNLWKTYHHHVEKFFDFLRINNDLRDIEFKRNLELKNALCYKAEIVAQEDNLDAAFIVLQELHNAWKEIGPVGRNDREKVWERFQAATKIVHKRRNDFYEKRKESFQDNFKAKIAICDQIKAINYAELTHHNKWQKQSEIINNLREDWKKIGHISREQNEESWTLFMNLIKDFNSKKNNFYKALKSGQKENLAIKLALVEKAEALADSKDWAETSNTLKKLQSDWKKSGMAPKKEADALWLRLRTACNSFFENLKKQNEEKVKEFEGNLERKQAFLKEVESFKNSGDTKADIKTIKGFINSWKAMGKVPAKNVKAIEGTFRTLIDGYFDQLDMDKAEKRDIQFKTRIEAMVAEGDENKLKDEFFKMQQTSKKCKEELTLLENNISFFKNAKDDNPLLKEARKNIEKQKEKFEEIKSRMSYLKSL